MSRYRIGLLLFITAIVSGCAPQVEPDRATVAPPPAASSTPAETSPSKAPVLAETPLTAPTPAPVVNKMSDCVSPAVATSAGIDATYEASYLNASTSAKIANLEYLISQIDSDYTCGTFFQETNSGTVRGVRVYKVSQGAQAYALTEAQLESAFVQLDLPLKTSVVLLADFTGLLPRIIVKTGWGAEEATVSSVKADKRTLYTRLATSNQSIFSSAISASHSTGDRYDCGNFSTQAAAQAFFGGLPDDVNRLDADNDGVACEALDNVSRPYRVTLADLPPVSDSPTRAYTSPPANSGRCYVSGYTRKDGTRVSGYYRRC